MSVNDSKATKGRTIVQMFSKGKLVGAWDRAEDIPAEMFERYAFSHDLRRVKMHEGPCKPIEGSESGTVICGDCGKYLGKITKTVLHAFGEEIIKVSIPKDTNSVLCEDCRACGITDEEQVIAANIGMVCEHRRSTVATFSEIAHAQAEKESAEHDYEFPYTRDEIEAQCKAAFVVGALWAEEYLRGR